MLTIDILLMLFLILTPLWVIILAECTYWLLYIAIDCYYRRQRVNTELIQAFEMKTISRRNDRRRMITLRKMKKWLRFGFRHSNVQYGHDLDTLDIHKC